MSNEPSTKNEYKNYRDDAIAAAEDFNYGDDVIAKLKKAKTDEEIARIMITARKEKWGL